MKKIITIPGLAALIFAGCSNPVENSVESIRFRNPAIFNKVIDLWHFIVPKHYQLFLVRWKRN